MRILSAISIFLLPVLVSCAKEDDIVYPVILDSPQSIFNTALVIEARDEYGKALPGVELIIGNYRGVTNDAGLMALENFPLSGTNYLTAHLEGYFIGSHRFDASPNTPAIVRVNMLSNRFWRSFLPAYNHLVSLGEETGNILDVTRAGKLPHYADYHWMVPGYANMEGVMGRALVGYDLAK